ncbi:DNA methyltransferase [Candidatus Harpocratesius sp.]
MQIFEYTNEFHNLGEYQKSNLESDRFQYGAQTIFFKSCEKMVELNDNSIDLIITSPPYNRGKKYVSDKKTEYNDSKSFSQYFRFLLEIWKECYRVASDSCVFFLNIGDAADSQGLSEKVAQLAEQANWIRIQDIIWVKSIYGKGHYTPSGGNRRLNNIWEHIFMFVKKKSRYSIDPKSIGIPYADKSNIGRYSDMDLRDAGNVWHICYEKTTGRKIKKGHAAPFPYGLPYKCMKLVPNSKTVLDPFAGTGTTLAVANLLNKQGFGYEKFPNKEVILNTFQSALNYLPDTPILIPHYHETIKYLIRMLMQGNLMKFQPPKSKIDGIRQQIVIDTLQKMQLKETIQFKHLDSFF